MITNNYDNMTDLIWHYVKKENILDMQINELTHAEKRNLANHVPEQINLFTSKIIRYD